MLISEIMASALLGRIERFIRALNPYSYSTFHFRMHFLTALTLLALTFASSQALSNMNGIKDLHGLCNKTKALNLSKQHIRKTEKDDFFMQLFDQYYTKVFWRVKQGKVVVKFKVDLEDVCTDLPTVMNEVQEDLQGMLFLKPKTIKKKINSKGK